MPLTPASSAGSGGGGADTQLSATVLLAPAASFDVTGIVATYNALRLVGYLRSDYAGATFDSLLLRFNNDSTAAHYTSAWSFASDAAGNGGIGPGVTTAIAVQCSCAGGKAASFSPVDLLIPRYAAAVGAVAVTGEVSHDRGTNFFALAGAGVWNTAAAVNRITVIPQNGANWVTGSAFYIYGVT